MPKLRTTSVAMNSNESVESVDGAVYVVLLIVMIMGFKTGLLRSAITILAYMIAVPIAMTATAAATASGATLVKVEFYNGTTLLGTSTTSPYAYTWPNVAVGNYPFTAKATDSKGATATSTVATDRFACGWFGGSARRSDFIARFTVS